MAARTSVAVSDFLREPLETAQACLAEFEEEAQRLLRELVQMGKDSRRDLSLLMQKFSQQGTIGGLRGRMTKLRAQGIERANELRGKAESFRAEAVDRLEDLQTKAIEFLGVASREQVEELSRELERLGRRLDRADRSRRTRKNSKRPSAEV
ncbi:MAG TPA: hypothetical protein VMK12_10890 [Anaeromyxobacteraceae bacterium]|nr:hypothetical protein [Anaeromyxobacteraceae bacterium]